MSHIYQTQITTEENLQTVLTAIENFNFDRLLAALKDRRSLSVSDILAMDARITEATSKLQTEYARLQDEAPAFNKRFVHRNNHYFSSAEALLRKIRSGVARFKDLYSRLTPNRTSAYQGLPMPEDKPSIYDRSLLGNAAYTPSLFPETVRPEVKQLYEHIVAFLAQMEDALNLCKDVLDDEALIREDAGQCRELYMDFKDEHYSHIKQLLRQITASWNDIEKITNPAICLREQTASDEEFSQQGFHNLEYEDVCQLATKEIVEESQRGEFSKEELMLFPDNRPLILRVRHIIVDFESYLPEGFNGKKIPASTIACLIRWSKPKEDFAFVKYFKKTYEASGGTHKVPSNSAVNVQKNDLNNHNPEYVSLVERWENIA
ncbi:MAG: hypothetical protein SPF23_07470 [Paludibacteraceae bacterium]|nr:hypothetical protein [Paludibacteraceae bacterium]